MTREEAYGHIGSQVIYCPSGGKPETGVITSVGAKFVFVCYRRGALARATDPADLVPVEMTPLSVKED